MNEKVKMTNNHAGGLKPSFTRSCHLDDDQIHCAKDLAVEMYELLSVARVTLKWPEDEDYSRDVLSAIEELMTKITRHEGGGSIRDIVEFPEVEDR